MGPILVTGGSGQVGGALARLAPAEFEIFAPLKLLLLAMRSPTIV